LSLALAVFIKRPQADAQIGVEDNIWHSDIYVNLILWLNQRHALKARTSVGQMNNGQKTIACIGDIDT